MPLNKAGLAIAASFAFGLLITFVAPGLLPDKYYSDSPTIRNYILQFDWPVELFNSFPNTALVYRQLGFESVLTEEAARAAGFFTIFVSVLLAVRKQISGWHPVPYIMLSVWVIPMAVFGGQYSKEPLAVLVAGLVLVLAKDARGLVGAVTLVALYALFFRVYWFLVLFLFVTNLLIIRLRGSFSVVLIGMIMSALVMITAADSITGDFLSDWRNYVNEDRIDDPDAVTAFVNIMPNTSIATDVANIFAGWVVTLVPLYLIEAGSAHHIAFMVFQLFNLGLFIYAARSGLRASQDRTRFALPNDLRYRLQSSIAWILAFSFVQGVFEPDYGSLARHQLAMLPMFMFLVTWRFVSHQRSTAAALRWSGTSA